MTQALVTTNGHSTALAEAPTVTPQQLDLIRKTVAKDATPDELQLYLYDCARQGVHPLDKLLHFTKRGGKYTPVTSIDLMRARAADTGDHAGTDDPSYEGSAGDPSFAAMVTVYRMVQGQRCAWSATARWSEYYPGDQQGMMWRKMPHLMLGKCAEALALRKAFPRQLAGVYAREEMDQADSPAPPARKPQADVITGEIVDTPAASYAGGNEYTCPDCGHALYRSKFPPKGGGEPGYYCPKGKGCGASFSYTDIAQASPPDAEQPADDDLF